MTPEEWYGKLETKPDIPLPEQEKQPAMSPEEWYGKLEINPLGDIGGLSGKAGPTVTSTVPKKDLPPPVTNKAGQTFPDFLISETGKGIAGMLTTPGQAYQHGLTPEEETNWAGGMSLNMLGQTPFAPKGSAGIFGGRLAANADLSNLSLAEAMHAKGMGRHQIWDATGWFQGKDGQWRFEIPDDKFFMSGKSDIGIGKSGLLGKGLSDPHMQHPDLAKSYSMEDLTYNIYPGDKYTSGAYYGKSSIDPGGHINVAGPTYELKGVMLHELMHAIQEKEGFAKGGNFSNIHETALEMLEQETPGYTKTTKGKDEAKRLAHEVYFRLAGEVEARNVQKRLGMSAEERKNIPPWITEDRPRDVQNVMFRNKGSKGVPSE